jgi:hypothetical protein
MSDQKTNDRVKRSVENLVRLGGRVVTVRLSPESNKKLRSMMASQPEKTTTECINFALENFADKAFLAHTASNKAQ